jgi:DNA-binding IclR family transcriptional regulator
LKQVELQVAKKKKAVASRGKKKQYSAPALSKGLDILELMTSEAEGLSLSQVAEKLGRSKGEIFRMLVVLEERGYVTLEPESDIYTLTLKIFGLAHQHSHVKRLSSVAVPVMRKLARATEQSCHLVIYFNGYGIVIAQQDSPAERRFGVRLGTNMTLPNTCSGHLLLAYAEPDKLEHMLAEQTPPYKKLLTKKAVDAIVKRVRKQGFEKVKSQHTQGVIDIGYPIFDYSGEMLAAFNIPFLGHLDDSHIVDIEQAQKHLEKAAANISAALGYKSNN